MPNVYSPRDFLPLEGLVSRKKASGLGVSLVIPAYNEAPTVGAIVSVARRSLMTAAALVDEIIVMDGDSTDQTAAVAAEAGARVCRCADVRPDLAFPGGKGTSLWKSQFVARGDIVVFVDGDITNFSPHFVYGLIGPLLIDPSLCCARAFYDRPLVVGNKHLRNQGGRVTELLVRPMLAIWYPEIARIFQPLAGEYAYRRSHLCTLPFCSGYGVELRLLLGTYRACGLAGMAQVAMGVRLHRNRTVSQLSLMSHAILLEFFRLLRQEGRISWNGQIGRTALARAGADWQEHPVTDTELPPACTIT